MITRRTTVGGALLSLLMAVLAACQPLTAETSTAPTSTPATAATPAATPSAAPNAPARPSPSPTSLPGARGPVGPLPAGSGPGQWPSVHELPSGDRPTVEPVAPQVVRVDQVGYLPGYRKLGLVADAKAAAFKVVDTATGTAIYAAELGEPLRDEAAGETVRVADFSRVTQPGTYVLLVPGVGRSPSFRIGDDVYEKLFEDSLASYDQLADLAPATWKTAKAKERSSGAEMDVAGGWPDAGDYGRYMPTATSTLGTLMLLAEQFPSCVDLKPSTGAGQPDAARYLQILRRELDWMLKMQRADGAVYHKVTPLQFGGFDKGSDNVGGQLYVFDATTPDTASFAAVMAQAARLYRSGDAAYAQKLLQAAETAWSWLEQHPREILPPEKEGTGGYALSSDASQRFWAAAELHATTGKAVYGDYARKHLAGKMIAIGPLSWSDAETYGLMAYLFDEGADAPTRQAIGAQLTTWADETTATVGSPVNPARAAIAVYKWASNKAALDNAALLLLANKVAPDGGYVDAALDQLHYVLGRNAMHKSYVTGYGADPVKNPHNRTMFSIGRIVPGVLVGGPNDRAEDGVAPASEGPKSYVDDTRAYSVNENAIDYNAPLVFVAALFRPPVVSA